MYQQVKIAESSNKRKRVFQEERVRQRTCEEHGYVTEMKEESTEQLSSI